MKTLAYLTGATALICSVAVIVSGDEGGMPDLNGPVACLNSPPLSNKALRGKVVLVNFWTYSCINSLRELPYMKAWAAKYKDAGLVVIGVHAPEFGFEKDSCSGLVQSVFSPPSRRRPFQRTLRLRAPRRRPKNALPSKNALP